MCDACGTWFMALFDENADAGQQWIALKVRRDGNPVYLDRYGNEDDAEALCAQLHEDHAAKFKKFGQFRECAKL